MGPASIRRSCPWIPIQRHWARSETAITTFLRPLMRNLASFRFPRAILHLYQSLESLIPIMSESAKGHQGKGLCLCGVLSTRRNKLKPHCRLRSGQVRSTCWLYLLCSYPQMLLTVVSWPYLIKTGTFHYRHDVISRNSNVNSKSGELWYVSQWEWNRVEVRTVVKGSGGDPRRTVTQGQLASCKNKHQKMSPTEAKSCSTILNTKTSFFLQITSLRSKFLHKFPTYPRSPSLSTPRISTRSILVLADST